MQILGPDDGVLKKVMTKALLSVEANGVRPGRRVDAAQQAAHQQIG